MSWRGWVGLSERATLEVTGDYTDQRLAATYGAVTGAVTGAVISGGIAAVEAVAGRVASMLSVARVSGGPRAAQALTPTVLAMIGRSLIERGESLHAVKVRRSGGVVYLVPAQEAWTVYGGEDPEDWIIDATLTGAETVFRYVAPRAAWLHIIRDASPGYPWRGVSPLGRSQITYALASAAEDALLREAQMPVKALIPLPQGSIDKATLRNDIQNRAYQVAFPETAAGGFGSGRASAPTTDWKPHRLQPMPQGGPGEGIGRGLHACRGGTRRASGAARREHRGRRASARGDQAVQGTAHEAHRAAHRGQRAAGRSESASPSHGPRLLKPWGSRQRRPTRS